MLHMILTIDRRNNSSSYCDSERRAKEKPASNRRMFAPPPISNGRCGTEKAWFSTISAMPRQRSRFSTGILLEDGFIGPKQFEIFYGEIGPVFREEAQIFLHRDRRPDVGQ